jgi:hypothetical protein
VELELKVEVEVEVEVELFVRSGSGTVCPSWLFMCFKDGRMVADKLIN